MIIGVVEGKLMQHYPVIETIGSNFLKGFFFSFSVLLHYWSKFAKNKGEIGTYMIGLSTKHSDLNQVNLGLYSCSAQTSIIRVGVSFYHFSLSLVWLTLW